MEEKLKKRRIERKSQITIMEEAKAEHARTATVDVGRKTMSVPCYIPKIRKSSEFDILCDEKKLSQRFQGLAFDIMDADTVLRDLGFNGERRLMQQRIRYKLDYGVLRERLSIFIDPCTEYFYFTPEQKRRKLRHLQGIPQFVTEILRETNWQNHTGTWNKVMRDNNLDKLINWNIRYQSRRDADVMLPPVPLISDEKSSLLKTAMEVNRKSAFASADVFRKEPAFYFLLNYLALRDMNQLNKIVEFIYDVEEEFTEVKAVFLKVKNFDIRDDEGRRNLGEFQRLLSGACRFNNRVLFALDVDFLGILSVCNGFDGFSEPLDGSLRDYGYSKGRRKPTNKGNYYHPERLKFVRWEEVKRIYSNNEHALPCSCPACSALNDGESEKITIDSKGWNELRREHLYWCRVSETNEIVDAITEKGDTRPISDKVTRSAMKDYLDVLGNPIN